MIDYEKEAREFKLIGIAAYNSAGAGAESRAMSDWLRSHDARVLREAAADIKSWQVHGNTFCGHISYLERRASEIEVGK